MGGRLVLHVLPANLTRGAQIYAAQLRDALDDDTVHHRALVLFDTDPGPLEPDFALGVASGPLRRAGLDPRALTRFRRVLRAEHPDVVVAHGGEPLKYAVLAGVPRGALAYLKVGIGGARLRGASGVLHRRMLRRAGQVAAVSHAAAAEASALGVPHARLRVIPNGRRPDTYAPGAARAAGTPVRLVFVGHLSDSKRPERFVDLVARLRSEGHTLDAVMAGDGPLLDRMRAAGVRAGIDVRGRVSDVPALLATSDVFVFTSVPEGEGMPGVLIEAGLAGLPVVTTDVPGAREVVDDGATGFVVGVDDVDALTTATRDLVEQPELRARLGAAARARCAAEYSFDGSLQSWRALLDAMMRDSGDVTPS
jgi:glycosyltransferase involved in cell wall biosynthesis